MLYAPVREFDHCTVPDEVVCALYGLSYSIRGILVYKNKCNSRQAAADRTYTQQRALDGVAYQHG